MKITDSTIIGLPIRVARDLMRHFREYTVSDETTQQFFDTLRWRKAVDAAIKLNSKIPRGLRSDPHNTTRKEMASIWGIQFKPTSRREVKEILASLLDDGWIEQNNERDKVFDNGKYVVTNKGTQLSVKRLVPRIDRAKADKIVRDMIDRIVEINNDPTLLDYVTKVTAFGSYVTTTDDLGNIDLYIEIVRRLDDYKEHTKASKAFNKASGKQFSNFLEELFHHQHVVRQRIKSRSPYISLHDEDDLELASATQTLYEFFPPNK